MFAGPHATNVVRGPPFQWWSPPAYPTTVVPTNRRDPRLEGGHSTNIGGIWTIKHDIRSPKFYELLIKTEIKGYIDLDLKNFFNQINTSLNTVNRLREDILPDY